ncbi:DUF6923 family protein [Actinokineospora sp. HUAS TT18]|uniref:DUF6923 family protein n=1 Tax=Actinokineospora sp. HUAS TT18 TaxID=3447451 RepID=UPI003F51C25C
MRRRLASAVSLAGVFVFGAAGMLLGAGPGAAAQPTCVFLRVHNIGDTGLSVLTRVRLSDGTIDRVGALGYRVDAIGHVPGSAVAYGLASRGLTGPFHDGAHVLAFDGSGSTRDLGPVRGDVPWDGLVDAKAGAVVGDTLVVRDARSLYSIDIDPRRPTYLSVVRTVELRPAELARTVDDFGVRDGMLYGVSTYAAYFGQVVRIDPVSGAVTQVPGPRLPGGRAYGAALIGPDGALYAAGNRTAQRSRLYRVELRADAEVREVAAWPAVDSADATGCMTPGPQPSPPTSGSVTQTRPPASDSGSATQTKPPASGTATQPVPTQAGGGSAGQLVPTQAGGGSQTQAVPMQAGGGSAGQLVPTQAGGGSQTQAVPMQAGGGSAGQLVPTQAGGGSLTQAVPTQAGGGSLTQAVPSHAAGGSGTGTRPALPGSGGATQQVPLLPPASGTATQLPPPPPPPANGSATQTPPPPLSAGGSLTIEFPVPLLPPVGGSATQLKPPPPPPVPGSSTPVRPPPPRAQAIRPVQQAAPPQNPTQVQRPPATRRPYGPPPKAEQLQADKNDKTAKKRRWGVTVLVLVLGTAAAMAAHRHR